MTYVTGGNIVAKRSPWRLSIVIDTVWGIVNFVGLFVTSLFSDPLTASRPNSNIRQNSLSTRGIGGNGGPCRPMGRVNHQGTNNMPMGGGCCG
ncbi:unnamed protein product [Peronospora belbahrii]|uniref:Selenoprotein K n=1 Tax=Peronospora belbahrii TaxID=622444 RepID=A0AAU9KV44_9STRA|nr:unnamed protein product [Peronospora belbahrii]CAH0516118.1 unnamed protein product [Peronospora belbahrii]